MLAAMQWVRAGKAIRSAGPNAPVLRLVTGAALALLALAAVSGPVVVSADRANAAASDTNDFSFDSFTGDYTLSRGADGVAMLRVVETLVAKFPSIDQNRGIIRMIPDDYNGTALETTVSSVTDEHGIAVPFTDTLTDKYGNPDPGTGGSTGRFLHLALGTDAFVHGTVTYVISYMQRNVVRSFVNTNSDEFYWDINGTGWKQPFGRVSATVHVAPDLVGALSEHNACYVGPQGSTTQCPITATTPPSTGATFTAAADNLGPGENLTVAIGFAPGTFVTPVPAPEPVVQPVPFGMHVLSGGLGVLSLAVLGAAIVSRVRSRRNARGSGIIIPQYSEPEGITILQAAHLMGRPATAIPAAIVRLAVRRNLRILAYQTYAESAPYSLQFIGTDGASDDDIGMLDDIFGEGEVAGTTKEFAQSDQTLMRALGAWSDLARASLNTEGFQARAKGLATGILLALAQVVLGIVTIGAFVVQVGTLNNFSGYLVLTALFGTLALIPTIVLAVRPAQPTAKGAEARDYLLGMKLYLTVAEGDRLRALQSPKGAERIDVGNNVEMVKLYEKLLPWAVLWGVEDQWMHELAVRVDSLTDKPDWIVSTNGFSPMLFSGAVHGISTALVPPVSSWSGSGGGSFSGGSFGGGFSGGGGGGGGGGGR